MPSRAEGAGRGLLALISFLLVGCATHSVPRPIVGPAVPPWEIPAAELGTQRLFRVGYAGPEGDGSLRVTLRLASAERYQVQAVDPLGRSLFTLDVVADEGLLLNHRSRTFCHLTGIFETSDLPLGPFPLASLPPLLLDRLPVAPPLPPPVTSNLEFVDSEGRTWSVAAEANGALLSWSLRDGDTPSIFWSRRDGWSVLSDRRRGAQIRWRQVVEEKMPQEIVTSEIPAGYRSGECDAPDLPDGPGDRDEGT